MLTDVHAVQGSRCVAKQCLKRMHRDRLVDAGLVRRRLDRCFESHSSAPFSDHERRLRSTCLNSRIKRRRTRPASTSRLCHTLRHCFRHAPAAERRGHPSNPGIPGTCERRTTMIYTCRQGAANPARSLSTSSASTPCVTRRGAVPKLSILVTSACHSRTVWIHHTVRTYRRIV